MDTSDLLRLSMNGGTKIYDQVNVEKLMIYRMEETYMVYKLIL